MGLSVKYDRISWELAILLGGAFNIVFVNALSVLIRDHIHIGQVIDITPLLDPIVLLWFVILLVLVFSSPLLLSLFLSQREPKLRTVSPFHITVISFIWIIITQFSLTPNGIYVLLFAVILTAAGRLEDSVATSILGLTAERDSIYFEHLLVYAEIEEVRKRLLIPEIRKQLHLLEFVEGSTKEGYILRTHTDFEFVNNIQLTKDDNAPQITHFKIVYYEKGKYDLRKSSNLFEAARKTSSYIRDVLLNRERESVLPVEVITELKNNVRDSLVDLVIDEMQGYYTRYRRLPRIDRLKIAVIVMIISITLVLIAAGPSYYLYAALTGILDVLLFLLGLPDIMRRGREA